MTLDEIDKAYPTVCRHVYRDTKVAPEGGYDSFDAYGWEFGKGWTVPIEKLTKTLSEISPHIYYAQVKQKFGGLRAYLNYDKEWTPTEDQAKAIRAAIDLAEKECYETCESCGKPGRCISSNHWYYTSCNDCIKADIEAMLKRSREACYTDEGYAEYEVVATFFVKYRDKDKPWPAEPNVIWHGSKDSYPRALENLDPDYEKLCQVYYREVQPNPSSP